MIAAFLRCTTTMSTPVNPDALFDTAKRWANIRPAESDRIMRAITLVMNGKVIRGGTDDFIVCGTEPYIVKVNREDRTSTCSCPDSAKGNKCKHRYAAALFTVCQGVS